MGLYGSLWVSVAPPTVAPLLGPAHNGSVPAPSGSAPSGPAPSLAPPTAARVEAELRGLEATLGALKVSSAP